MIYLILSNDFGVRNFKGLVDIFEIDNNMLTIYKNSNPLYYFCKTKLNLC